MLFENIKRISKPKIILIFAIVLVIYQQTLSSFVMGWSASAGVTLMDFIFGGYGTEEVYHVLDTLGSAGRSTYVWLLLLDCVMGLLYLGVLLFLIGWLLKKYLNDKPKYNWLLLAPVIAMLSDWIENLSTFCLIKKFPTINPIVVGVESTTTTLKFTFIGISVAVAIVIFVYGLVKKYSKPK